MPTDSKITCDYLFKSGFKLSPLTSRIKLTLLDSGIYISKFIRNYVYTCTLQEYSHVFDNIINRNMTVIEIATHHGKYIYVSIIEGECTILNSISDLSIENRYNKSLGYVYLIRSKYGYKIGCTKTIKKRAKTFNVTLPFDWSFHTILLTPNHHMVEQSLHSIMDTKRINGEWFNLSDSDVAYICENIKPPIQILLRSPNKDLVL